MNINGDRSDWSTKAELAMYDANVEIDGNREREMLAMDEEHWDAMLYMYGLEDEHGEVFPGENGGFYDRDGDHVG